MDKDKLYPELFKRLVNDRPNLDAEFVDKVNLFSETLMRERWTLPPQITVDFMYNIDFDNSPNLIQWVIDFYVADNYNRLNFALKRSLKYLSKVDSKYKKVLNECYLGFLDKRNILVSITLLTVIEGLLAEFLKDKNQIKMISPCRDEKDHVLSTSNNIIEINIWKTLYILIENLYKNIPFKSEEPANINRNWLLHGRSRFELGENECIFLFNTVFSLAYALEHK